MARVYAMPSPALQHALPTMLLCGEQSAVQIFAREVQRGKAPAASLRALAEIEQDELLHERALLSLTDSLPDVTEHHALKRRAQRFFTSLGRVESGAQQFRRIAVLDQRRLSNHVAYRTQRYPQRQSVTSHRPHNQT